MASKNTENATPDRFDSFGGQETVLRAPFLRIAAGDFIQGIMRRHAQFVDDGKAKDIIELELTAEGFGNADKETGEVPTFAKGTLAKLDVLPGIKVLREYPVGTEVLIQVVGKVKVKKGMAWTFKVRHKLPR